MKQFLKRCSHFVLIIVLFSSCEKELFPSTAEKIQGEWAYEKVKFQKNFSLSSDDLTSDFENLTLELKEDFTLFQSDAQTGQEQSGTWRVNDPNNADGSIDNMEILVLSLNDQNTGDVELIIAEFLQITKNKIKFNDRRDEGTFRYVLSRK